MTMISKMTKLISICLISVFMQYSYAQDDYMDKSRECVNNVSTQVINIVKDTTLSQNELSDRLERLLERYVHFQWMAKFAIGRPWKKLTPEQRTIYVDYYHKNMLKRFSPNFRTYKHVNFKNGYC